MRLYVAGISEWNNGPDELIPYLMSGVLAGGGVSIVCLRFFCELALPKEPLRLIRKNSSPEIHFQIASSLAKTCDSAPDSDTALPGPNDVGCHQKLTEVPYVSGTVKEINRPALCSANRYGRKNSRSR